MFQPLVLGAVDVVSTMHSSSPTGLWTTAATPPLTEMMTRQARRPGFLTLIGLLLSGLSGRRCS